MRWRGEWRYVAAPGGGLCVAVSGQTITLQWSADIWDSVMKRVVS